MIGTKLYKGKYTNAEYADLAVWCNQNNATIEDKGEYCEVVEIPAPSLDELKEAKLNEAGSLFAQKRDAIRFVQLDENRYYGFDCASEDITNFLARWTPLAIMGGGESQYKVWLNETEKDLVMLSLADYNLVYQVVSASQLEAYDWYKVVQAQVNACTTVEELEAVVLE